MNTDIGLPKYVMRLCIAGENGLCFSLEKAPNWFHRKMMTLLLGFKWEWLK